MTAAGPEKRVDELYRGPLEEFTKARNELASDLRTGGDAAAAKRVKGLKKPTRAAWLVNQLSTRKSTETKKLLELGSDLRQLQEKLIAGKVDREELREAAQREQRAIEGLVKAAEAIGADHDVGSAVLDRVTETLQAASSDPELAEQIERGRVEREQRATSLGLVGPAGTAPSPTKKAPKKASTKANGDDEAEERRAEAERARQRRAAEKRVASAEKSLGRARGKADRARDELAEREEAVREAEAKLADAKDELKGL